MEKRPTLDPTPGPTTSLDPRFGKDDPIAVPLTAAPTSKPTTKGPSLAPTPAPTVGPTAAPTHCNVYVEGLYLVDADKNKDASQLLTHDTKFVRKDLPRWLSGRVSVVIDGCPASLKIHRVDTYVNGRFMSDEYYKPYSLFGDKSGDYYKSYVLWKAGDYAVKAVPFLNNGVELDPMELTLSLVKENEKDDEDEDEHDGD